MSLWNLTKLCDSVAFTPPARARSTSPHCNAATAWCTAARDDAQAISTGMAGPSKPRAKATRPNRYARCRPQVAVVLAAGRDQIPVLCAANPRIDAGAATSQPVRIYRRIFQGLPAGLQQHPLLGVHHSSLNGGNAEEPGVELVNPFDEAASAENDILGGRVSGKAMPGSRVLPAVRYRSFPRFQHLPEG